MKIPNFNHYFPLEEYEDRISRIRRGMAKEDMDAIILAGACNVDYTSGLLHNTFVHSFGEGKILVIIFADDPEPILILSEGNYGVSSTTAISDIRFYSEKNNTIETMLGLIKDEFGKRRLLNGRIGIEINEVERMGFLPTFYKKLCGILSEGEICDCSKLLYNVRSIKSQLEMAKIREAVRITCTAVSDAFQQMHAGMQEQELAQLVAIRMAELNTNVCVNNPWFMFVTSDGHSPANWDSVSSEYRFKKGDMVFVDCGARYHGYTADMIRCASIGDPDPFKAKLYYDARNTNLEVINAIKPGMTCKEINQLKDNLLIDKGYATEVALMNEYGYVSEGHGIGLLIHEPPFMDGKSEEMIEENMALSFEGNLFYRVPFPTMQVSLKNEENFFVTANGNEIITEDHFSSELFICDR